MEFKPLHIRINHSTLLSITEPEIEKFDVTDIARVLSKIARFNGHGFGDRFMSVAEHSVNVAHVVGTTCDHYGFSKQVKQEFMLAGLFHDGHEFIIGDVATPVKELFGRPMIRKACAPMDEAIAEIIGIDPALFHSDIVKDADAYMLGIECAWLFNGEGEKTAVTELHKLARRRGDFYVEGFFSRKPKIGLSFEEARVTFWEAYAEICELAYV